MIEEYIEELNLNRPSLEDSIFLKKLNAITPDLTREKMPLVYLNIWLEKNSYFLFPEEILPNSDMKFTGFATNGELNFAYDLFPCNIDSDLTSILESKLISIRNIVPIVGPKYLIFTPFSQNSQELMDEISCFSEDIYLVDFFIKLFQL